MNLTQVLQKLKKKKLLIIMILLIYGETIFLELNSIPGYKLTQILCLERDLTDFMLLRVLVVGFITA